MDFLFLMIACLFFSVQFIFQKCFQKNTKGGYGITVWNQFHIYIRHQLLAKDSTPFHLIYRFKMQRGTGFKKFMSGIKPNSCVMAIASFPFIISIRYK